MPGDVDARIRDALEATVAAGTARVAHSLRADEPYGGVHDDSLSSEGVIDLRGARAALENDKPPGDDGPERHVYIGPSSYYGPMPDGLWRDFSFNFGGGPNPPIPITSPLWMLEALAHLRAGAAPIGEGTLEGENVTRFRVQVSQRGWTGPRLLRPLMKRDPAPDVEAEAWLDRDGRIRLFSGLKPPAPSFPDWYPAIIRSSLEASLGTEGHRVWQTTELWDFGVPVTIAAPNPTEIRRLRRRRGSGAGRRTDPRSISRPPTRPQS